MFIHIKTPEQFRHLPIFKIFVAPRRSFGAHSSVSLYISARSNYPDSYSIHVPPTIQLLSFSLSLSHFTVASFLLGKRNVFSTLVKNFIGAWKNRNGRRSGNTECARVHACARAKFSNRDEKLRWLCRFRKKKFEQDREVEKEEEESEVEEITAYLLLAADG